MIAIFDYEFTICITLHAYIHLALAMPLTVGYNPAANLLRLEN